MLHYVFAERLECYISLNPRVKTEKKVECPLKQRIGQSEEDYQKACKEIFKATREKAEGRAGAETTNDDDEEEEETPEEETEIKEEGNAW